MIEAIYVPWIVLGGLLFDNNLGNEKNYYYLITTSSLFVLLNSL